ncbi:MAG: N-6 DNA methylase, partial [Bdellovibrionales bacterium]|nr:N-6 DNA methylase [Bdellovibrionales bacterium]
MNKHVKAFYQKFSCLTDVDPEKHYCLLLAHQWALESTQALDEHCLRLGVSCELALDNFPYPPRLSVLELVELFELTCCNKDRDKEGKFYTPETVLQCMCTDLQFSNATTIFDPSCGAGAFLLVAADRILSANRGTYEDNLHTLNRCVFGIDRDSFAVTICKELLALLALRYA